MNINNIIALKEVSNDLKLGIVFLDLRQNPKNISSYILNR